MQEKLEKITKELAKDFRRIAMAEGIFDNNFKIEFTIGRYSIWINRMHGKYHYVIDLSDDIMTMLRDCVKELHDLWMEEGDGKLIEDITTTSTGVTVNILVDGDEEEYPWTIGELELRLKWLQGCLNKAVQTEDYESAARHQQSMINIKSKLDELRSS